MAMNTNYQAEVAVKFNDNQLQSQLKKLSGQTVSVNVSMNGSSAQGLQNVNNQLNNLQRNSNSVSNATKNVSSGLNNVAKSANHAGQSMSSIVSKVAKFYLATVPVQAFQKAINQAITTIVEFDSAITEFQKVSTLSGKALDNYTQKLQDLGSTVARTKTEMVEMATEFKKGGFSEQDSAQLAQLAALYQNTADEELSAAEATSVLVSQIKAFDVEAEDAIHITDAINQVSQDFAVSSGDIGKGLTQAGAALSTYGNSFDQTIGLTLGQLKPIELLGNPYSLLNYNITMKYA